MADNVVVDHVRVLLRRFVEVFENDNEVAFSQTIVDHAEEYQVAGPRSIHVGHVPPIQIGEQFSYRNQLRLASLHNQPRKGICHNHYVAT
jgi:hypothetical protein